MREPKGLGGPSSATACSPDGSDLCLTGSRFRVVVNWKTPQGQAGNGQAVPLTGDTGYFWFFSAASVEMVVKVLNACALNGHYWVFAGGLTDVEVDMTVTDTVSGATRSYSNKQSTPFKPIQDTTVFAVCP